MKRTNSLAKKFLTAFVTGLLVTTAWVPASAIVPGSWTTAASRKERVPKFSNQGIIPMEQVGWKTAYLCNSTAATLVLDENGVAPTSGLLHRVSMSSGAATTEQFIVYDSSAANTVGSRQLIAPLEASTSASVYSEVLNKQFHGGLVFKMTGSATCGWIDWSPDGKRN